MNNQDTIDQLESLVKEIIHEHCTHCQVYGDSDTCCNNYLLKLNRIMYEHEIFMQDSTRPAKPCKNLSD